MRRTEEDTSYLAKQAAVGYNVNLSHDQLNWINYEVRQRGIFGRLALTVTLIAGSCVSLPTPSQTDLDSSENGPKKPEITPTPLPGPEVNITPREINTPTIENQVTLPNSTSIPEEIVTPTETNPGFIPGLLPGIEGEIVKTVSGGGNVDLSKYKDMNLTPYAQNNVEVAQKMRVGENTYYSVATPDEIFYFKEGGGIGTSKRTSEVNDFIQTYESEDGKIAYKLINVYKDRGDGSVPVLFRDASTPEGVLSVRYVGSGEEVVVNPFIGVDSNVSVQAESNSITVKAGDWEEYKTSFNGNSGEWKLGMLDAQGTAEKLGFTSESVPDDIQRRFDYMNSEEVTTLYEELTEEGRVIKYYLADWDGQKWVEKSLNEKYKEILPDNPKRPYIDDFGTGLGAFYLLNNDFRFESIKTNPVWTGKYIIEQWNGMDIYAIETVLENKNGDTEILIVRLGAKQFEYIAPFAVRTPTADGYLAEAEFFGSEDCLKFLRSGEQIEVSLTFNSPENIDLPLEKCNPELKSWCDYEMVSNYQMFVERREEIAKIVNNLKNGVKNQNTENLVIPIIKQLAVWR